jgi:hypothetical protein
MKDRMFPIMGSEFIKAIPWDVIAPHEMQAGSNHSQTLERLAQRGGLSVNEACAVLDGVAWGKWSIERSHKFWCARLMGLVHRFEHDATTRENEP